MKRLFALLLSATLLLLSLPVVAAAEEVHLTEVPSDYIGIYTKEDLNAVREDLEGNYILMNDIIFTTDDFADGGDFYNGGAGWLPIGPDEDTPFEGVFDGNGYAICNIRIESKSDYTGFFGFNEGVIKNLELTGEVTFKDWNDRGVIYVGGIAGGTYGTIQNCINRAKVVVNAGDGDFDVGGVVGIILSGRVRSCLNSGEVNVSANKGFTDVGGVVGSASTYNYMNRDYVLTDCHNTGYVRAYVVDGAAWVGGVAGLASIYGTVESCGNNGSAVASSVEQETSIYSCAYAGGIVGSCGAKSLTNCYNTGEVSASMVGLKRDAVAGGVIGIMNGTVLEDCYSTGSVQASTTESYALAYAGGIVGYSSCKQGVAGDPDIRAVINRCFNLGAVNATTSRSDTYAGGVCGYMNKTDLADVYNAGAVETFNTSTVTYTRVAGICAETKESTFARCYNVGVAKPRSNSQHTYAYIGALVAAGYGTSTVSNAYYLDYAENSISSGTIACTNAQMQQEATFEAFDFNNVWEFDTAFGYLYPQLQAVGQPVPVRVEVAAQPTIPSFAQGGSPDLMGARLLVEYSDGDKQYLKVEKEMLVGLDVNTLGTQEVGAVYYGIPATGTFVFEVVPRLPTGITLHSLPTKTEYSLGVPIDPTGGWIRCYYNNYTQGFVPLSDATLTYDKTAMGEVTVTVTYEGCTATFKVTFTEPEIASASVTPPAKTTYLEGEGLDLTGGYLTITYVGELPPLEVPLADCSLSGYNAYSPRTQRITVSYKKAHATFEVVVTAKAPERIEVTTLPDKLTYLEGRDKLNLTGGRLKLFYNNGTSESVPLDRAIVKGFDNTQVGQQTLTVEYRELTTTFEVVVNAKTPERIEVTTLPAQTVYGKGVLLDPAGGRVTLYYDNGTTEELDLSMCYLEPDEFGWDGTWGITVSYSKMGVGPILTTRYELVSLKITSIAVTALPAKTVYRLGEEFDPAGGRLTPRYNSDEVLQKEIDLAEAEVTGFDSSLVGKQTLTVSYQGQTATFEVEILPRQLQRIEVTTLPDQTVYEKGAPLNLTGGRVTLYYDDNTTEEIALTDADVVGYDCAVVGEQILTVTYRGLITALTVTVRESRLLGDVDGDGSITSTDARLTLQYYAGKIGEGDLDLSAANVDGDSFITSTDARLILQYYAGKIDEFPH